MMNDIFAIIDCNKTQALRTCVESLRQDACFSQNYATEIFIDRPEICVGGIKTPTNEKSLSFSRGASSVAKNYWHYGNRDIILHGKICGNSNVDFTREESDFNYLANAISKVIGIFLPIMLPFYTKNNLDFVLQLPL